MCRHSMFILCTLGCFQCNLLHNHLYETTEMTYATLCSAQAARITEVVSFNQMRFSLQRNRWGSFPFGMNNAVRDEVPQNSSPHSRRINTHPPAFQPCWDLYSLNSCITSNTDSRDIFSISGSLLHLWNLLWLRCRLLFEKLYIYVLYLLLYYYSSEKFTIKPSNHTICETNIWACWMTCDENKHVKLYTSSSYTEIL